LAGTTGFEPATSCV